MEKVFYKIRRKNYYFTMGLPHLRLVVGIAIAGGASAAKFPNSICRGHPLTLEALAAAPAVVQAKLRWLPLPKEPAGQQATDQLITARLGKVWKAAATTGSPANGSAVSGALWTKQRLKMNITAVSWGDSAECKKLRRGEPYLLLMEQGQGFETGEGWRLVFPPVRWGKKPKKLLKSLFCKVPIVMF